MSKWPAILAATSLAAMAACTDGNPGGGSDTGTVSGNDTTSGDTQGQPDTTTGSDTGTDSDTIGVDSAGTDTDAVEPTDGQVVDITEPDVAKPDVPIGPDVPKDTGDTSTTKDNFKELLVKILGPTGREWVQNEGQKIQLSGVAFGSADEITWASSTGDTGVINAAEYWVSGVINLKQGDNHITVTAKKGEQVASDTVHVTYNPVFTFDGAPEVAPNVLFVNESAKLVVHFTATAAATGGVVDASSIKLVECDATGAEVPGGLQKTLLDNGSGGNCDDVQKDSVYSACVDFSPQTVKTMYFRVKAQVNVPGVPSYTGMSPVTPVDVVQRFNQSECNGIVSLQKKVKADYLAAIESGKTPKEAQQAAIDTFKADATVAEAGASSAGGYGVWVRYKTGRLGALNLAPKGMRGSGGSGGDPAAALPTYSVGTRRALTLAPFSQEFSAGGAQDEAELASSALKAKQCPPFAVDSQNGSGAVLRWYREMSTYGLVAITGHGDAYFDTMDLEAKKALGWEHFGSQEVVWSGETVSCGALSSNNSTCNSAGGGCPSTQTCVKTSMAGGTCVDHTQADIMRGRVVIGDETYGFLPSFIRHHTVEPFPASIVYLGACRSMWNGSLAVQLYGNGAAAVVGYSDYVTNAFAGKQGTALIDGLLNQGKSVNQAITASVEEGPFQGRMRLLGNGKANTNDSSLINPSWDLGKLTGWKPVGDGRVISRLGVTIPVAGKFMGIISTGLGFTTQNGSLEQPFCVEPSKNELCFFWKFYSEEFIEWCGSQFMDTFTATLQADTGKVTMTNVYIDSLCPYDCGGKSPCEPGSPSCKCGKDWKTLTQADVTFDQGGVFMTPWQKQCTDVSSLAGSGKKVDLKFFATDKGDSIYDTVILVDEVTVK